LTERFAIPILVEHFNKESFAMAFVNYSVPDDVKDAFNLAFAGKNKSAVIAVLMREAVEQEFRRRVHISATEALLRRGETAAIPLDAASNDFAMARK
jgi:hypothetical protein